MKKFYIPLMVILATTLVARSQKTWVGLATGGSWATGSNWSGNTVPGPTDNVLLNGGFSGIITNVANVTIRTLTVTGNSTVTLDYSGGGAARTLNISNDNGNTDIDLSITGGSQLILAGTNLAGISLATNADANIAGTLTVNTGRTFTTGGGNSVTTVTGTIDNKGTVNSSPNGSLSFADSSFYIHSQNGGQVPDANWDDSSYCIITGVTNIMPVTPDNNTGFDQAFGNFIWNSTFQTAALSFGGDLERIDGNFTVNSTGTGSIGLGTTQDYNLRIDGNIVQTGGTLVLNQTSGDGRLIIGGDFNMSGGVLSKGNAVASSTGEIDFSNNTGNTHSFIKTGGTITGKIDFEVAGSDRIDFGTYVLNGSEATFRQAPESKIITSHPDGLNSAGALGSIQTAVRSFSVVGDFEFRGAKTGVFNTGDSSSTQQSVVRNLTINNSTGTVTLSKPVTIYDPPPNGPTSRLYLQNGVLITTATNLLTLRDNVQGVGLTPLSNNQYNPSSYVSGPMRKVGNDQFIFPVGKIGSGLRKIGLIIPTPPVGSNTTTFFTAEFIRANPQDLSDDLETGLAKISACEYWTLDRNPGGTNQFRVLLSWENNSGCNGQYVTNPYTLRVAHLLEGKWKDEGSQTTSVTGGNEAGTITSNNAGITPTFSPFALASSSAEDNPLPVVFANVKAYEKNSVVQIEWSNLTEKDVAEYTIERSANGKDFSAISQQTPNSNQNDKADYIAVDAFPIAGVNYYRIKGEETTGKIVYSKILSVNMGKEARRLMVYPNPVSGNQVTISMSNIKRGQFSLRVVNMAGQDIFKQTITNVSSMLTQTLDFPLSLKPGIYNMVITGNDYRESKIFIVQ